jgi:hypothetical protein
MTPAMLRLSGDERVETASVLARSEAGLAAVRALLGRLLLSSISDTGDN